MEFSSYVSTAVSNISVNDNIVTVTFKGSGNSYDYQANDVTNFVVSLQNVIENNKSVGQFINKAIKEDKTLQILANV
jgi:hypothetical protein